MARFILFLDVDGVLHPVTWTIPGKAEADLAKLSIDEFGLLASVRGIYAVPTGTPFSHLPALEAVLRPHLAELSIVISSSWRKDPERYAQLLEAFSADVRARIVGMTPHLGGGRPREIYDWLKTHADPGALPVVIDDDNTHDWRHVSDRVVCLHPGDQLAFSDADAAILEALLSLRPEVVQRLTTKLGTFNATREICKRDALQWITNPQPCFGDFEASSLKPEGYPIEVAWSLPTGEIRSHLIKPVPEWGDDWDMMAEDLHGISREQLDAEGIEPLAVALNMNRELAGEVLYFDGGGFDRTWLSKLYEAAGIKMSFTFGDFDELLFSVGIRAPRRRVETEARARADTAGLQRHRAGNDVQFLQRWYQQALALMKTITKRE